MINLRTLPLNKLCDNQFIIKLVFRKSAKKKGFQNYNQRFYFISNQRFRQN